jgi:hypothetical protein
MSEAKSDTVNQPQNPADGGFSVVTPLRTAGVKRLPLNSLEDVRREMARLYRAARGGQLDTRDASRMGYMLAELAKMIQASEVEARIAALEAGAYNPPALGDDSQGD